MDAQVDTSGTMPRRISIQIMRIVACVGVFVVHFGQRTNLDGMVRSITDMGSYGVQLFFLISGYLAAAGLERESSIARYYQKRGIRLLPLYVLIIIWYLITETLLEVVYPHIPNDDACLGWLRYVFFLNCFVNSNNYFWSNLGITWTIPIFFWFYAIVPVIKKLINRLHNKWFAVLSILIVVSICVDFIYPCKWFHYSWILLVGMMLCYVIRDNKTIAFFVTTASLASIFLLLKQRTLFLTCILVDVFVIGLSCEPLIKKLPQHFKNIINKIDAYSYSMYLVHGVVFCSVIDRIDLLPFDIGDAWKGVIAVVLSITGAWVVHTFYEKPVQDWLKKRLFDS